LQQPTSGFFIQFRLSAANPVTIFCTNVMMVLMMVVVMLVMVMPMTFLWKQPRRQ
jgi:hypothetical protein